MKKQTTDGMKYESAPLKSIVKKESGIQIKLDKEVDFNKEAIKKLKIEIKSKKRSIRNHKLKIKAAKLVYKSERV